MATRYIHRGSALPPGPSGLPNANSIRIDSDDNLLKVGTGSSGTTENTLVDTSTAQTLTNKTLTSPIITGVTGAITSEIVTTTNNLTAAESGTTFFLNAATEFDSVLPAPAQGLFYRFIVTDAPETASYTVSTNAAAQILAGRVHDAGGAAGDVETTATGTTITFVDGQSVVGDMAEVWSDGTSWFAVCSAAVAAGITITG